MSAFSNHLDIFAVFAIDSVFMGTSPNLQMAFSNSCEACYKCNGVALESNFGSVRQCSRNGPQLSAKKNEEVDFVQGVPSGRRIGFVDLEFDCSTVCPTLPRLVGI